MTKDEVVEFVSQVVEHTEGYVDVEKNDIDSLTRRRVKMAAWLWTRYRIAVKELVVSAVDGMPYLKIEFTNDKDEKEEAHISLEKHKERIAKELAGNFNVDKSE